MTQQVLIPVSGASAGAASVAYRRIGRKMLGRGRIIGVYPNGSVRIQPDRRGWRQIVVAPAELNSGKGVTISPPEDAAQEPEPLDMPIEESVAGLTMADLLPIMGNPGRDRLTAAKTETIIRREGYEISGFILILPTTGHRCLVELSAVRWLPNEAMLALMGDSPS